MKARIELIDGIAFRTRTESGHALVMDASTDFGGNGQGPTPMELVLTALGGCLSMDVMNILRKSRMQVTDCVTDLDAGRADEEPRVFSRIHARLTVSGHGLEPKVVDRAIRLALDKYCPVAGMVGKSAEITYEFETAEAA